MFHHASSQTSAINYGLLIINLLILGLAFQQGNSNNKSLFYSKMVHTLTIKFIKIFPYTGFIPMVAYSLSTIEHCEITYKLIAGVNILFFMIFYQLNEISNWAYRFI
jgi:hypothetical protein